MKRLSLALLAAGVIALLLVVKAEATHVLGPIPTFPCRSNPCVWVIADGFSVYGDLHGDSRYRQAAEMLVNDWSKSGTVLLKLGPHNMTEPYLPGGGYCPAGNPDLKIDDVLCDPDGPGPQPSQCSPICPAGAWTNDCLGDPTLGVGLCVWAFGNGGNLNRAHIQCKIEDNCNPLSAQTRYTMCQEYGHVLGLNHEGGGCMFSTPATPRPTLHDILAVASLHPPLGSACDTQACFNQTVADNDEDNDGVRNTDEASCGDGALWYDSARFPERSGGGDDNGNTLINELLTATYVGGNTDITTEARIDDYDCDGDTWTGTAEKYIFTSTLAKDQNRCMPAGWPPDPMPQNGNGRVQIDDVTFASGAFGSTTTPRAEIASQNNYVGIDDVAMFSALFGQIC